MPNKPLGVPPPPVAPLGGLIVGALSPAVAWAFDHAISPRLYSTAGTLNGGTVVRDDSRARLSTSSAPGGVARLATRRALRYSPGVGNRVVWTAVFASPRPDTRQIIGLGDASDGMFFGYDGLTFGVMTRSRGADVWVPSTTWADNALSPAFDPRLGNTYQVRFRWLGYGLTHFYVFDDDQNWINVHTIAYSSLHTTTTMATPTLPIMAEIRNTGNTTDMVMFAGSAGGMHEAQVEAPVDPLVVRRTFVATRAVSGSDSHHVLTIWNKPTGFAANITNHVSVRIRALRAAHAGAVSSLARVSILRDAGTTPQRVFADVDTDNSPIALSTTVAVVNDGELIDAALLAGAQAQAAIEDEAMALAPGDMATVAYRGDSNAARDLQVAVVAEELF